MGRYHYHDGVSDFPHGAGSSEAGWYYYHEWDRHLSPDGPLHRIERRLPAWRFLSCVPRWVSDARHDPFVRTNWVAAGWFVFRTWRWHCRQEAAGWLLPPELS